MNPEIIIAEDPAQLVEMLAARLVITARRCIDERGSFSLALSGGSTPKALYQKLASPAWKSQIDWSKCDIVFGDDRAVAGDDALSNYRMARETLLDFVDARIYRIATENDDLERAAADYETVLRGLGGRLDVVLLGSGRRWTYGVFVSRFAAIGCRRQMGDGDAGCLFGAARAARDFDFRLHQCGASRLVFGDGRGQSGARLRRFARLKERGEIASAGRGFEERRVGVVDGRGGGARSGLACPAHSCAGMQKGQGEFRSGPFLYTNLRHNIRRN